MWRVDAAPALATLGDTAAARRLAEQHLEQAEHLGLPGPLGAGLRACASSAQPRGGSMRLLARRARNELRATGARPRRTALSGIDALTPAEHRIATLAAQGHGNREIAEQLYITRRTVETHLTHVFQKLDITTRAELPALLDATGQPEPAPRRAHALQR